MEEKNYRPIQSYDIILFDGVCNLCNHAVTFIIDRDSSQTFRFASLQSEIGKSLLKTYQLDDNYNDSLVLISQNQVYLKSTAALRIAKKLDSFWPVFYFFIIIPAPIRNVFYNLIAKYRYNLFGKDKSCRYPSEDLVSRFL